MIKLGNKDVKIYLGNKKVKYIYKGNKKVYSSGNIVTYYVDNNTCYTEEVESGNSCLSPTSFNPSKSGWTFIGWKDNTVANGDVLSNKTMDSEPITLYAVYSQTLTHKFISYNNTKTINSTRYYNAAGNIINGSVTVPTNTAYSGWTWRGWGGNGVTTANSSVAYANGASITGLTGNTTYYGLYSQSITLSYNSNGGTGKTASQTGTRYYNVAGNYSNPLFILASNGFTKNGYTFQKWASGSTSGTQYTVGTSVTLSSSTTFYAIWLRNTVVLFNTNDQYQYNWHRDTAQGWGKATPNSTLLSPIDCTDYKYCTVRIKGQIDSTPSGATENYSYIKIGFTENYGNAIEVIRKVVGDTSGNYQSGNAYGKWYDLKFDISGLTGDQNLNVFIGGAYQNGGTLDCSKITMSNT